MRVLLVTGSFPPMTCGVGDYTRSLAEALAGHGAEVGVLTSEEAAGGGAGPYAIFPVIRDWKLAELPLAQGVVRRFRPDVIHVQYPTQGYRGELADRLPALLRPLRIPIVETWHEGVYWPLAVGPALRTLVHSMRGGDVIVVRPEYRRKLRWWNRLRVLRKRLHYIPGATTLPQATLVGEEREALRRRYAPEGKALLVFFGFLFEHKGIDDLLRIQDPARHQVVLVGAPQMHDAYQAELVRRVRGPLAGHVTLTGFLPPLEAARLLAVADAVVLPFRLGGGDWNSSIKAAVLQGTFVLTTSYDQQGFDAARNVYYAWPRDVEGLRTGLSEHLGRRRSGPSPDPGWPEIAMRHLKIYARQI